MKIEFKGGKKDNLESKAIIVADDYQVDGNKINIPIDSLTGEVPFEELQIIIDDSPITLTWDSPNSNLIITFGDKKHVDVLMGLIKMNKMKNRFSKFFK